MRIKNILKEVSNEHQLIYMQSGISVKYVYRYEDHYYDSSYYILKGTVENFNKAADKIQKVRIHEMRTREVTRELNKIKSKAFEDKDHELYDLVDHACNVLNGYHDEQLPID